MRKWSVKPYEPSEIQLPLGPNGAMAPISTLSQEAVQAYFVENQTINLTEAYGYKQPSYEADVSDIHDISLRLAVPNRNFTLIIAQPARFV
jgi:hypothetical protein